MYINICIYVLPIYVYAYMYVCVYIYKYVYTCIYFCLVLFGRLYVYFFNVTPFLSMFIGMFFPSLSLCFFLCFSCYLPNFIFDFFVCLNSCVNVVLYPELLAANELFNYAVSDSLCFGAVKIVPGYTNPLIFGFDYLISYDDMMVLSFCFLFVFNLCLSCLVI